MTCKALDPSSEAGQPAPPGQVLVGRTRSPRPRQHRRFARIAAALATVAALASIAVVGNGSAASAKTSPPGFLWHIQNKTGKSIYDPRFTISGYNAAGHWVDGRDFDVNDSSNDWFDPAVVKSVAIYLDGKRYADFPNDKNHCFRFYNDGSNVPHVGWVAKNRLSLTTTGPSKCNTKEE